MRKTEKKLGCLVLVLCLLLALGPAQAMAAAGDGNQQNDSTPPTYLGIYGEIVSANDGAVNTDKSTTRVSTDVNGVFVSASDGGTAAFKVEEDVKARPVGTQVAANERSTDYGNVAQASLSVHDDVNVSTVKRGSPAAVVAVNVNANSTSEGDAFAQETVGGSANVTDEYAKGKDIIGVQVTSISSDAGGAHGFADVAEGVNAVGSGEDEVTGLHANAKSFTFGEAVAVINVGTPDSTDSSVTAVLNGEEGYSAVGALAEAESSGIGHAAAYVSVNGDVTAKSPWSATGAEAAVSADSRAEADISIKGKVTAEGAGCVYGVEVSVEPTQGENYAIGGKGTTIAAVNVGEGIVAKGTGEYVSVTGADIWVTSGGINSDLVGTVTVEKGGVTATAIDADGVIAESSSASGINAAVENEGSGTARGVVKITGDVAADADSEANGVFAIASEGELEISVDGTIRASANKAVGINTNNDEWAELQGAAGEKAKLNISADGVQVQGGNTDNDSASGVFLVAAHGGTGTVAIGEGGITASGAQASGAEVNAYGNSVATLTVAGDVSVTSTNGAANGVMVWAADGSAVNVTLDGELAISAADSDYISIGLNAEADNASVNMVAEGIKATGNAAVGAVLSADGKADVKLAVSGDVSGEAVGLGLGCSTGKQLGNVDALVEGTVSGGVSSIVLSTDGTVDGLSLTVWKAEVNEDDQVAITLNNGNMVYDDAAKAFEKGINYIVKRDEGVGAAFSVTKADGSALTKLHGKEVASENDKLLVKSATDGYRVTGAFNGEGVGKSALQKDDNGNYFVIVPKGGGLYLTATLEQGAEPQPEPQPEPEPEPQPEPQPEPEPEPQPEPQPDYDSVSGYTTVIFDLGGGTINGESKLTLFYFPGQVITLPEAPVKDGFRFAGWKTEFKGETLILQPGETFQLSGYQSFAALWEKE